MINASYFFKGFVSAVIVTILLSITFYAYIIEPSLKYYMDKNDKLKKELEEMENKKCNLEKH